MRLIVAVVALFSIVAVGSFVGCGSSTSSSTTIQNQPPTIEFTYAPFGVAKGSAVELTVSVSDPNPGDNLRVSWSITRGTLLAVGPSGTRVNWQVPTTPGVDTVTVVVTDGFASSRVVEALHVGTRFGLDAFDGVWTAANSPYILAPPSGRMSVTSTATVEAGVEFFFSAPGGGIQVDGSLVTQGTAARPVVFRPDDRTLRCQSRRGWWEGVEMRGTGSATLSHTEIWYGTSNIRLLNSSSARLVGCTLRCGKDAGARISSSGSLVLDSCTVDNNASSGVAVQSFTALPDSVVIRHSYIGINGNSGLLLDLRDLTQQVPVRVWYNKFEFNFTHGVFVQNQVFPSIHRNHFESNGLGGGLSNLWLQSPYPSPVVFDTLDVTQNYWGSPFQNVSDIDLTIHDRFDDLSIGTRAVAEPWLDTSPVDGP